ncbi:flavin-containing monooxygenase [Nocardioides nitrophenolicus]|uniref:flavin-containing monooxygenase n=1 Tax=Nocardioides nitrophenolicus TaxID=60489 RepID=UPI0019592367|nr:NAD(P)/FAD-dependent oxidoreductase [Nocardioides nitrophenolicus]MBM7519751.1 cation diffusion facilitator CzcD-associated flavoprotein CzcO [Nocardioides nitrophenolicus]
MRIAIVGAGFAGLASAKVLRQLGHEVTVHDKAPDVGGVWSLTRRYPGLRTQNNKQTYRYSDHPMPRAFPQWLEGAQVQQYLEAYVDRFGLAPCLRLGTEVERAAPAEGGGWEVVTSGQEAGTEHFDHLVVANGIFCEPAIPDFDGVAELTAAGGRLIATSELASLDEVRDRHVVMVGYGKSSCDVAVEVSRVAASTTVVARGLLWKVPRRIKGVLNYKYLLLTRLGEGLFPYQRLSGVERVLHARDSALPGAMLGSVEKVVTGQLGLDRLGLVPEAPFASIAKASVSLATEGFYEAVADGTIGVHRDTVVARFLEKDGRPHAELTDGAVVPADVVVCGTGFRQEVPFLPEEVQRRLLDERGNFALYRQILPVDVPDLTFAGYNSSFFSPLSAEMSAVWIGSYLSGHHRVPDAATMRAVVRERVAWMEERTDGHSARGTNVVPFSMHNIDEVLAEVGLDVGRGTKALQWLLPVRPASYRRITRRLARRVGSADSP